MSHPVKLLFLLITTVLLSHHVKLLFLLKKNSPGWWVTLFCNVPPPAESPCTSNVFSPNAELVSNAIGVKPKAAAYLQSWYSVSIILRLLKNFKFC